MCVLILIIIIINNNVCINNVYVCVYVMCNNININVLMCNIINNV